MAHFSEVEKQIKSTLRDREALHSLWQLIDFNGNGIVSLAEIDKLVVDKYPLLNHKPALMRAYKATIKSGDGDDWVEKREFKKLLANLFYFNKLFWLFESCDDDKDRRMTYAEFRRLLTLAGNSQNMSEAECQEDFRRIDTNGGGIVLFDEFCRYICCKDCPESLQSFAA